MYRIVTLLEKRHADLVQSVWHHLAQSCGAKAARALTYPHFSWHAANYYECEEIADTLRELTQLTEPFFVRTTGVGVFTGENPQILLQIEKTPQLTALHEELWHLMRFVSFGTHADSAPEGWIPHIPLATDDVTPHNIGPAMASLCTQPFKWAFKVTNLAILDQRNPGLSTLQVVLPLGDQEMAAENLALHQA